MRGLTAPFAYSCSCSWMYPIRQNHRHTCVVPFAKTNTASPQQCGFDDQARSRTPSAAYGPGRPQVQTHRRRSVPGWPTSRSPNRPPSRNGYSPATDAEPAGTRNKPGMTSVPIYFCTFSVFQPSTLNSPFRPQSNFSGFSKPITRSALGFLSLSASATLVSVLFSTNEP